MEGPDSTFTDSSTAQYLSNDATMVNSLNADWAEQDFFSLKHRNSLNPIKLSNIFILT